MFDNVLVYICACGIGVYGSTWIACTSTYYVYYVHRVHRGRRHSSLVSAIYILARCNDYNDDDERFPFHILLGHSIHYVRGYTLLVPFILYVYVGVGVPVPMYVLCVFCTHICHPFERPVVNAYDHVKVAAALYVT